MQWVSCQLVSIGIANALQVVKVLRLRWWWWLSKDFIVRSAQSTLQSPCSTLHANVFKLMQPKHAPTHWIILLTCMCWWWINSISIIFELITYYSISLIPHSWSVCLDWYFLAALSSLAIAPTESEKKRLNLFVCSLGSECGLLRMMTMICGWGINSVTDNDRPNNG